MRKTHIQVLTIFLVMALLLPYISTVAQAARVENSSQVTVYFDTTDQVEKHRVEVTDEVVILSWETPSEMIFEQYSGELLVDRVVVEKENVSGSSSDIEPCVATNYSRIDTVAIATYVQPIDHKTMQVFQRTNQVNTTYTIPSTAIGVTVATFIAQVALGLAVPGFVASQFVAALISTGAGTVVGGVLSTFAIARVDARKTMYQCYGKDSKSLNQSSVYTTGSRYYVTDQGSRYYEDTYSEGLFYEFGGKFRIANTLCKNLYGNNYEYRE